MLWNLNVKSYNEDNRNENNDDNDINYNDNNDNNNDYYYNKNINDEKYMVQCFNLVFLKVVQ